MKKAFALNRGVILSIFAALALFLPLYHRSRRISFYVILTALALYGITGVSRLVKIRLNKNKKISNHTAALKQRVFALLPLQLGLSNLFISLVLVQWFIHYQSRPGIVHFSISLHDILVYGGSLISLNLLVQFFNSAAARLPNTRFLLNGLLIYLCYLFGAYHYITRSSFDFSVISENVGEAFTIESMEAVAESVGLWAIFAPPVVILFLAVLDKLKKNNFTRAQEKPLTIKAFSALLLYVLLLFSPLHTMDDVTYFFHTAVDYYTDSSPYALELTPGEYPLVNKSTSDLRFLQPGETKPHIFIIMVESFNNGFVESRIPWDRDLLLMPFFNKKMGEGVYVERFYGNSIQTCKGQLAVLCSIIPSIRGKVFNRYDELSLHALPTILKTMGYDTIFFQGSKNLRFDNTNLFMSRNGFSSVETAYTYLDNEEKKRLNGWYMRDDVFYKKFFQLLDSQKGTQPSQPVFSVLATIHNHSGFNRIPREDKLIYPVPLTKAQRYANSIHLVDKDLEVFFRELDERSYLQNSIVIITGDHSYPVGGHGVKHNESGFYEESFRIPFLLLWPGKIPPQRITGLAYSQMDIAPTILDLLGINQIKTHFQGVSILKKTERQHPVYLVQPYSGRYVGVVRYPYKFLFHERTGKEYLYNLENDSQESVNLLPGADPELLRMLRADIPVIYRSQLLIENNAVWPANLQ